MVNRHRTDLVVVLERLVELARRRFAMLPLGVPYHVVARVFRRMMRLRLYMLRSAHVRLLAVDRLMALRHVCEFRTRNTIRWGKCVHLVGYVEGGAVCVCCVPLCAVIISF
jgi:hypothetical protein